MSLVDSFASTSSSKQLLSTRADDHMPINIWQSPPVWTKALSISTKSKVNSFSWNESIAWLTIVEYLKLVSRLGSDARGSTCLQSVVETWNGDGVFWQYASTPLAA